MKNTDSDIYFVSSGGQPARFSLFWHYSSGGVDCRIFSSENWSTIVQKWRTDPLYGLACNLY